MKKLIIIILTICITIATTSCTKEETAESHPYGVFNLPRATWGCTIDEFLELQEKKKEDFKVEEKRKEESGRSEYNYKRNIKFLGYDCEAIYSFGALLNKKNYFLISIDLRIPLENNKFESIAKDVYETITGLKLPYVNYDSEKLDITDFTKNYSLKTTKETSDLPEELKDSADKGHVKMMKEMGYDKLPRFRDQVFDDSYSLTTYGGNTLATISVSNKSYFNPDHAIVTMYAPGLAWVVADANYYDSNY